jgi:hypothetical protein
MILNHLIFLIPALTIWFLLCITLWYVMHSLTKDPRTHNLYHEYLGKLWGYGWGILIMGTILHLIIKFLWLILLG